MAKALLEERGYTFETVDLTDDPEGRVALVERAGGQKTVPQIFMNGRHMGGYEALKRLVQDGTL
jgi:glutaredoxin 3